MSKPELKSKGGDEVDAFSKWRKLLIYMGRTGVVKKAQRHYNKRVRKHAKQEIEREVI